MVQVTKREIFLSPTKHKFENHGVFNPASVAVNGDLHFLYRATSKGNFSSIGYCSLETPTKIAKRNTRPLLTPQFEYEAHGIEDPRLVEIDGTFFMTYTAYDGKNAFGALAVSGDMKIFERLGIITPQMTYQEFKLIMEASEEVNEKYLRFVKMFYERGGAETVSKLYVWDKDVIFFPRKINDKYAFFHRVYPDIQIVYFNDTKELTNEFWREYMFNIRKFTVLESKYPFEASYIGGGCPPIETNEGWVVIYHGVEDTLCGYVYHACAALLDINDPTKEIGRLSYPLFSPELEWEKKGVVSNVVFPTGTILQDDTLYIYYGAADKCTGLVSVSMSELLSELTTQKK